MAGIPIIGLGERSDPKSFQIFTAKRRFIPNEQRIQRSPASMEAAKEFAIRNGATRTRSLNSTYNCVGMVFASRRTCIDTAHIEMILVDDGYTKIPTARVLAGDIVLYRDGAGHVTHVGIVVEHSARIRDAEWVTSVISQWGNDGEYIHDAHSVPDLLGTPAEFWRMGPLPTP